MFFSGAMKSSSIWIKDGLSVLNAVLTSSCSSNRSRSHVAVQPAKTMSRSRAVLEIPLSRLVLSRVACCLSVQSSSNYRTVIVVVSQRQHLPCYCCQRLRRVGRPFRCPLGCRPYLSSPHPKTSMVLYSLQSLSSRFSVFACWRRPSTNCSRVLQS